jgi:phosphoenolpyruvate synthase/pyruvate phosphate dikinase
VKGPAGSGTLIPYTIDRKGRESEQKMAKHVYFFGDRKAEGDSKMRNLLGGKGADLAEMTNLGISVPPGFTISTEVCTHFMDHAGSYPDGLAQEVRANLSKIEKTMGAVFGDPRNPLLVSVRSGARTSMPGMMDTVLNLGLNDTTVEGLVAKTKTPRFAYDSYRRFIHMYASVVMGVEHHHFENLIHAKKEAAGLVERKPRRGLPADPRDSPPLGHRGQRPGDGVRKHGDEFGDRCRLHARPGDGGEAVLRRVPPQRAGRRRGRGDQDTAPRQYR